MASEEGESSSDVDSSGWRRFSEFWTTLPGVLAGIAAVVGATTALLTATHPFGGNQDPPAIPTTTVEPVGCRFRITAPKNGATITNRGGTSIEGTACSNDDVWVFDYPPGARRYYRENETPLDVMGERWSEVDEHIGAVEDPVGTKYRIIAMRVGRACSRALEAEDNTVPLSRLPVGCPDVKSAANVQSVVVVKRKP